MPRTKFLALHQLQECSAKTDKAGLLKFILFHTSEDRRTRFNAISMNLPTSDEGIFSHSERRIHSQKVKLRRRCFLLFWKTNSFSESKIKKIKDDTE